MRRLLAFALFLAAALGAQPVVIRTSTLLDGKGGVLKNKDIVVEGSKIVRISEPKGAATYDLTGYTLMPGWIDTHVHLGWHFNADGRLDLGERGSKESPQQAALRDAGNAWVTLQGGFTTVQSLGAPIDADLRQLIEEGIIPGPRVITALRPIYETTGNPEQIREFVRKLKADHADLVKLFATKSIRDGGAQSMTDDQIRAACGEAKAMGLRSVVHAHASGGARVSIEAGCTAIEHGTFLSDDVLDLMAAHGTYFDPNFLVLHNYLENKPKFLGIGNYNAEGFAAMEKGLPEVASVMRRAMARKVKIVFGTDGVAGAHGRNAEEFIYRVRDGGQAPMDAIVSATSLAAQSLGLGSRIGSIAEGMEADFVATQGNPLDDITAVRRVVFVMKGGKIYRNTAVPR